MSSAKHTEPGFHVSFIIVPRRQPSRRVGPCCETTEGEGMSHHSHARSGESRAGFQPAG
jgi:hypothetical protein